MLGSGATALLFGKLVEHSVKHEFDKRLEGYKAQLQHEFDRDLEGYKAQLEEQARESLQQTQESIERRAVDRLLFQSLMRALPSSLITNIADLLLTTFGIHMNDVLALDVFVMTWDQTEYEFLDAELDAKRRTLLACIREISAYMPNHMMGDETGVSRVPKELDWEKNQQRQAVCQRITELWTRVEEARSDLIRTCRAKLHC